MQVQNSQRISDDKLSSIFYGFINRMSFKDIGDIYTSIDLCRMAAQNSGTPMQLLRDKQQQELVSKIIGNMMESDKVNLCKIIENTQNSSVKEEM
jgi:hypothetical protein